MNGIKENVERVAMLRELTRGRIFGATFEKSDGTLRRGTFRSDAKRKGGLVSAHYAEQGLAVVYDMNVRGYRVIRIEGLRTLRLNGREIEL